MFDKADAIDRRVARAKMNGLLCHACSGPFPVKCTSGKGCPVTLCDACWSARDYSCGDCEADQDYREQFLLIFEMAAETVRAMRAQLRHIDTDVARVEEEAFERHTIATRCCAEMTADPLVHCPKHGAKL